VIEHRVGAPGASEEEIALIDPGTACAEIDLAAFRDNVRTIAELVGDAQVMVVVKADGYGHGMIPCARAARQAGVSWLGAATPGEALALRAAGDDGRILTWLYGPGEDLAPVVAGDVDVTASTPEQVGRIAAAARVLGIRARLQLKADTGLSRNGAPAECWPELCRVAADAERSGTIRVTGIWSHFAAADEPGHPSVALQQAAFESATEVAARAGLRPDVRHLANSAGALIVPDARLDLVRVGIAAYGIDPAPGVAALVGATLRPVMRLRARLANVKRIAAGSGVSYGWTWIAPSETTVGLVPLGYGDGIPRSAGNRLDVAWRGQRAPVRGRICMDQFVVQVGPEAEIGDEVVLFGPGDGGEPTAEEWADRLDTIGYEIVTRVSPRVTRVYVDTGRGTD
jgi:alanine racemase